MRWTNSEPSTVTTATVRYSDGYPPTWLTSGAAIAGAKPEHLRGLSRKAGAVWVPKVGWVRFRLSRAIPGGVKSYRVTCDQAGRWHVSLAIVPPPIPGPGTGEAVGVDRGVAVSAALSTGSTTGAGRVARQRPRRRPPGRCWPGGALRLPGASPRTPWPGAPRGPRPPPHSPFTRLAGQPAGPIARARWTAARRATRRRRAAAGRPR